MTQKLAYTYDEAAEQLGVEKQVIRALVHEGELVAFVVSSNPAARSKRISHTELTRFVAAREEAQRQKYSDLTLGNTARNRA